MCTTLLMAIVGISLEIMVYYSKFCVISEQYFSAKKSYCKLWLTVAFSPMQGIPRSLMVIL